jgi:hypothetical protein
LFYHLFSTPLVLKQCLFVFHSPISLCFFFSKSFSLLTPLSKIFLSQNPILFLSFHLVFISRRKRSHPALSSHGSRCGMGRRLRSRPRAARRAWLPSLFFIMVVGHVGYGLCQGLGKWGGGERERERGKKRGKKLFLPLLCVQGRRSIVSFKTTPFCASVFFFKKINKE